MILNYINIKILVCLHVLNVQLHLYLILMWPILYPDFHNHTSLLAIQLNLYSWLQFFLLHGKILFHQKIISKNFIALCTTYIFDVFRKSECNRFVSERVNPVATQNSSLQNTCFVSYKT